MNTILFYSAIPTISRDQLSLMQAFKQRGHQVIFLNRNKSSHFRAQVLHAGIEYYEYEANKVLSFLYLVFLCYRKKITIVYSHLEPANFLAVIAQFFVFSKVIICRHHIDEAHLYHFDKSIAYKLTYKLARKVVVVSERAKRFMVEQEKVPAARIYHINLSYDFSCYEAVKKGNVLKIKDQLKADLLLVTVCRLTEFKRPQDAILVLKKIRKEGVDAKLVLLGEGELEGELRRMIQEQELDKYVYMPGYVHNVLDYLAAADFLIHPSVLESSCVTVKEAGLVKRPVIACRNVGDFNELIENGKNGFLVSQEKFVEEAFGIILHYYIRKDILARLGEELHNAVLNKFDVSQVIGQYDQLISA